MLVDSTGGRAAPAPPLSLVHRLGGTEVDLEGVRAGDAAMAARNLRLLKL
jgi:hypothetical protein